MAEPNPLYEPYAQIQSPLRLDVKPLPQDTSIFQDGRRQKPDDFWGMLGQALLNQPQGQRGGTDLGQLLATLKQVQDPQGWANKLSGMPSYMPGSMSPFNIGYFRNHYLQ